MLLYSDLNMSDPNWWARDRLEYYARISAIDLDINQYDDTLACPTIKIAHVNGHWHSYIATPRRVYMILKTCDDHSIIHTQ